MSNYFVVQFDGTSRAPWGRYLDFAVQEETRQPAPDVRTGRKGDWFDHKARQMEAAARETREVRS
jgi:hypothetical protein